MVLNPTLYGRLQEEFGHVDISHAGVAMSKAYVVNPISNRLTLNPIDAGEYYRCSCSFCGDRRGRLWINHRWGVPDEETGSKNLWLAICYNENCLSRRENVEELYNRVYGFKNVNLRGRSLEILPGTIEEDILRPIELPGEVLPLHLMSRNTKVAQYFASRSFDHVELGEKYDLSFCTAANADYPLAHNRLVIPIKMDGQLVGWQCRYVGDIDWKRGYTPKYYSRPNMPKRMMLYNYDIAKQKEWAIVVEGPADVWVVGDHAVAIMGKKLSVPQLQRICTTWEGGVVGVMLDGDALEAAEDMKRQLQASFKGQLFIVPLPIDRDPGDYYADILMPHITNCALSVGINLSEVQRKKHDYDGIVPRRGGAFAEDRPTQR